MNPAQLLTHFDRITDAPYAIPNLRRFILDLAVRGKLVEQDPKDEPASELLKRIHAEKAVLFKTIEMKNEKQYDKASPTELPFDLRPGWEVARLCQTILSLQTGPFGSSLHQSDYAKGGIPVINPACIKHGQIVPVAGMAIGPTTMERLATFKLKTGDVVLGRRGEMGRCAVVTEAENGWLCGTGCIILRLPTCAYPRFLVTLIGSPMIRKHLGESAIGVIMQSLNQSILMNMVIALPPLAEQHRIVAKVNELMALCDRVEAAQVEREGRRDRLAAASLHHLNNGAEAKDAREYVRFHLHHLSRLTTRPEHIKQLRQTILNLAVRGRLVPQDSKDEPATSFGIGEQSELKDRLVAILPRGWNWARVEDIAESRLGKMLDKAKNSGKHYRYLRNTNIHWFDIRMEELKTLQIEDSEIHNFLLRNGDVLICEGGHGIGRTSVWRANEADVVFQKALHRVRPGSFLNSDFFAQCVFVYFHAGILQTYYTGVGIPHFTGAALSKVVFPLPPLAEQHRIVAKVEELLALCDRLEAQLSTAQTESRRLLEAILHEALAK